MFSWWVIWHPVKGSSGGADIHPNLLAFAAGKSNDSDRELPLM
jgi:hypothetical protein